MSEFHQNNFFDDFILSDNHGQNNVVQMTDQHFNTMMGMPQHPQLQLLPGIHCEFLKIEPSSPTQIQLEPFGTDQTPAQSMTEFSHQGLVPMQGPNRIKKKIMRAPSNYRMFVNTFHQVLCCFRFQTSSSMRM